MVAEFYRPPNTDNVIFQQSLTELTRNIDILKPDFSFICADQNYDLLKSHVHSPTRDYFNQMLNYHYIPYILKPTRVTHRSSTLIDNIYVKSKSVKLHENLIYIITDGMSDHYPCICSHVLNTSVDKSTPLVIEK